MDDRHPLPSELPPEEYEKWVASVMEEAQTAARIKAERPPPDPDPWPIDQSAWGPKPNDVSGYMWAYLRGD